MHSERVILPPGSIELRLHRDVVHTIGHKEQSSEHEQRNHRLLSDSLREPQERESRTVDD